MKEALSLNGNELVEFTTFYSIGYAVAIVPSQLLLTKIRPSWWLPFCEILWGIFTLVYVTQSPFIVAALLTILRQDVCCTQCEGYLCATFLDWSCRSSK